MEKIIIRNENETDFRIVEELTREAFWNLHVPGCDEHYLVHKMRSHSDFIPSLDLVAVLGNTIVGSIMYIRSSLVNNSGNKLEAITFGPVSVLPDFQRMGIGSELIRHSINIATSCDYKVIVIHGHPHNYCKYGFRSSKDYLVSDAEGRYPYSLLVLDLEKGILQDHHWKYFPGDVYNIDPQSAQEYDKQFTPKIKEYKTSQEEFSIASRAYLL